MKIEEFNFKIVKSPKKTTKPVGRSPPGGGTKKPSEKPATDLETRIEGVAKVPYFTYYHFIFHFIFIY